jgi:DNA-binding CsgD family transcriptional regulator
MSHGRLLALTEEVYDAAAGGTPWAAVGDGLKALVGASSVALMAGDFLSGQAEILCHADIPEDAALAYRRHYRNVDLWTNRAAEALARGALAGGDQPRALISGELLVPDAEFLRSEFYCDFGRHYGLRYVVGTVVPLGEAGTMPIGLHRPEGRPRFGAAERRLLEAVLPHLRRALQLRHRLKGTATAAAGASLGLAALDALAMGVLVLDAECRVLLANAAAEAMAATAGAALRLQRGTGMRGATVVSAGHHADRAALGRLVRATALGVGAGGTLRLRGGATDGAAPVLAALVMPLPGRLSGVAPGTGGLGRAEGRALVLLRDVARGPTTPGAELLQGLFGLTRAEAEVARALCGGATKGAVAASRGLRETTVRSQVRAVLDKTGAANLRDLERLLASLHGM